MIIVATSDTHTVVDVSKIPDGDVFIHAGDLMKTGYPDDFAKQLKWLKKLPHKLKLYVPGNHDFHMQVYPGPALQELRAIGVWVLGLPGNSNFVDYELPNGMRVMGLPFVTGLPRWAFNMSDTNVWKYVRELPTEVKKADIIVSHAPPRGILDKTINGSHGGVEAYNSLIIQGQFPKVKHWISGHVHEGYGTLEKDGCTFYNVALSNRMNEHANPPLVLDL